jgi:hypothetical protein
LLLSVAPCASHLLPATLNPASWPLKTTHNTSMLQNVISAMMDAPLKALLTAPSTQLGALILRTCCAFYRFCFKKVCLFGAYDLTWAYTLQPPCVLRTSCHVTAFLNPNCELGISATPDCSQLRSSSVPTSAPMPHLAFALTPAGNNSLACLPLLPK